MTREDLYSLAFRYRKTKLWLRLFDTQVFAVRTEKGETIFICIMGRMGEHISVAVYRIISVLPASSVPLRTRT